MGNTNATESWNAKWFQTNLQETLKAALVCEKICRVDNSDGLYIWNPYGSAPTTVVQAIIGTYVPATYSSTADTLTVAYEFIVSEHIYHFEQIMQHGDIRQSRTDEMTASVARAIDKYVLNVLCDVGTGALSTLSGGFTSATNINDTFSRLWTKWAGYADSFRGLYIVLEATDISGVIQAGAANGFSFADAWLKNGLMTNYMGIDVYVVPDSTFVTATYGSAFTNSGHRVAGVKGVATYASPRGITYDEKKIGASTGIEVCLVGYCGVGVWYQKRALTVDITVTA